MADRLPSTPERCRRLAAECERMVSETDSQLVKQILMFLATRWQMLADEDETAERA